MRLTYEELQEARKEALTMVEQEAYKKIYADTAEDLVEEFNNIIQEFPAVTLEDIIVEAVDEVTCNFSLSYPKQGNLTEIFKNIIIKKEKAKEERYNSYLKMKKEFEEGLND